MWNGYGVCSNLAPSGEPHPPPPASHDHFNHSVKFISATLRVAGSNSISSNCSSRQYATSTFVQGFAKTMLRAANFRDGHRHYHRVDERRACAHTGDSWHWRHAFWPWVKRTLDRSACSRVGGRVTVNIFSFVKKMKPPSCLETSEVALTFLTSTYCCKPLK